MVDAQTIFDKPHHQSLELLASQALAEGNIAAAFKLADRRYRILPLAEPHCYVLRGEASYRRGAKAEAIVDIAKALEIAPDNVIANRRMLTWADGTRQLQAARALIGHERNFESLCRAAHVLCKNGQRLFGNVTVLEDAIEGWAVWQGNAPLEVSITAGADAISQMFAADPFHPLGEYGRAARFRVERLRSTSPQTIVLATADRVFYSTRTAGNDSLPKLQVFWPRPQGSPAQSVTVIVPVYGDYDATRVCIECLLDALRGSSHRAILVDDATPDARIAKYLTTLAAKSAIEVMVNRRNLGFIGSINRAFERVTQGDIIILNSDTIVPRGFINRLAAAARSSPDIGTVTPLSNNGEFVSFPIPYEANPLVSRAEVERIDAIAAKANADKVVDIPSGIGFCLYITRACLDRVGPLSEDFARGYLEDADFCLRAREQGFRNVCAPSAYVGHAGSKSFGAEKRSLVLRNIRVLEQRFPKHGSECAAFMAADPLQAAREAIERTAVLAGHPRLLVVGGGVIGAVARQRARAVTSTGEPVLILEIRNRADGAVVKIIGPAGEMPQSLQFNLAASNECKLLVEFIRCNEPSRTEIFDPANTPFRLVELLLGLKIPYNIFIADAGMLGPGKEQIAATAVRSLATSEFDKRGEVLSKTTAAAGNWTDRWLKIADGAQRIIVPSAEAEAFATRVLSKRSIDKIARDYEIRRPAKRKRRTVTAGHLGFVPVRCCADEQWLMSEIARQLGSIRPDLSTTVIGATLDDIDLMRSSNAFVTGAVDPEEFEHLVDALGIQNLFISTTRPLFAHPILSIAASCCLPTAYFDWSAGRIKSKKKEDLPINPRSSLDELIDALTRWMPER